MNNIPFESKEHEQFFRRCLSKVPHSDPDHQALFYVMGISDMTRNRVSQWFDFKDDSIKPDVLDAYWQTGGTRRLTRLAFNLWNGYNDGRTSPYELFDCSYGKFMMVGIQLRFPDYCRLLENTQPSAPLERNEVVQQDLYSLANRLTDAQQQANNYNHQDNAKLDESVLIDL